MSNVEKIINVIINDAQQKAEAIEAKAAGEAEDILAKAQAEADKTKEKGLKKIKALVTDQSERGMAVAMLDMRKTVLAEKQSLIDQAFESVFELLDKMSDGEYKKLITSLILKSCETGTEEIILSKNDKVRLGSGYINEVNEQLKAGGKKGELKQADKDGDFRNGFVLASEGIEFNNSFDTLLKMEREAAEPEVAAILFKNTP